MSFFKKKNTPSLSQSEFQRTRLNIARTIYSTVINQCYKEAVWKNDYDNLPKVAAIRAIAYADALIEELKNTKKQ